LVTLLAARVRETNAAIAAGTFLSREGRLACTLLELAGEFGQDVGDGRTVIRQMMGQSDLAAMTGIARESASRLSTIGSAAK
jgi:CRP/FNR family transcriptional regulator, cyclic AMP receptor protein